MRLERRELILLVCRSDPKTVLCAFFKAGRCQKGELAFEFY
jgi:hypothetical protein